MGEDLLSLERSRRGERACAIQRAEDVADSEVAPVREAAVAKEAGRPATEDVQPWCTSCRTAKTQARSVGLSVGRTTILAT